MEEDSWDNWPLLMEINHDDIFLEKCHNEDDDDEFLREIFLEQPPFYNNHSSSSSSFPNSPTIIAAATAITDGGVIPPMVNSIVRNEHDDGVIKRPCKNNTSTTPRSCILSFGDSTMKPITHNNNSEDLIGKEESLCCNNNKNKRKFEERVKKKKKNEVEERGKKGSNSSKTKDHIMAERKRRQELSEKFIALSATIPALNKTDKTSILRAAIDYVKELKEKVEGLEKEERNGSESMILIKRSDIISGNEESSFSEISCEEDYCTLPEIEARVLGNEILIEIHCEKQNGIDLKILDQLQSLHLSVTATSILPFGNFTLGITIISKMNERYNMKVNDLVKRLRQVIWKSHMPCHSDPY